MTNEEAQAYLKSDGTRCPVCKNDSVQGYSITINAGVAHQQCTCDECEAAWTDSYHLAAIIDSEGNIFDKEGTDAK